MARLGMPSVPNSGAAADANRIAGVLSLVLFRVRLARLSAKTLGASGHALDPTASACHGCDASIPRHMAKRHG